MLLEPWRIDLLGGLRLRQGDRFLVRFPTQKAASLLAYLALHSERVHPREQIADLLWPDSDTEAARHSLRQALLSLRRILEPPGTPRASVVASDRSSVWLNREAVKTDVDEFGSLLCRAEQTPDIRIRAESLSAACALYAGPLLPGVYDDWTGPPRERLADQYRAALLTLSRLRADAGDLGASVDALRQALVADGLFLEARVALVQQLIESGRMADAAREISDARRCWRRELEEDLPPELQRIAGRIPVWNERKAAPRRILGAAPPPVPDDSAPRPRLPLTLTRFFGRQAEIAEIQRLLHPSSHFRLVTLTGHGGAGKTRTAVEAARILAPQYGGQVWFVPLADVADSSFIPDAIFTALAVERAAGDLVEQIVRFLGDREALLLADNLEHLEGVREVLRRILAGASNARILATSRVPLDIPGERQLPLSPLATPGSPGTPSRLLEFPSVEMFVDRARQVKPDFQVTTQNAEALALLCARLEGIPLAIELAAARASVLTPSQMLKEMSDRFGFLTSRSRAFPERHRGLGAALEASVESLNDRLRQVFSRLSVFRGGFTLEAVQAVCTLDNPLEDIEELCKRSLVTPLEAGSVMRFHMLETIREYAAKRLSEPESAGLRHRHAEHFAAAADALARSARGPAEAETADALAPEHDNIRAAIAWALDDEPALALDICAAMQRFWYVRGYLEEGRRWTEAALESTPEIDSLSRVRAHNGACTMARDQGHLRAAETHGLRAMEMARRLGDRRHLGFARHNLALIAVDGGEYSRARKYAEAAIEDHRATANWPSLGLTLNLLGNADLEQGELESAEARTAEAYQLMRVHGNDWAIATVLNTYGVVKRFRGELQTAREYLEQSLGISRQLNNRRGIALPLYNLAMIALEEGDLDGAQCLLQDSVSLFLSIGDEAGAAFALEGMAAVLARSGCAPEAAEILGAAQARREAIHSARPPIDEQEYQRTVADVRNALGNKRFEAAALRGSTKTLQQAFELSREAGPPVPETL